MIAKFAIFFCLFFSVQLSGQIQTSLECVEREFNVVVHVVKDNNGNPLISLAGINSSIAALNKEWAPICMKFNLCDVRYVDNYNFMYWIKDTMESEFLALYYESRVINIIVINDLIVPSNVSGYANLGGISSTNRPYIIVEGGAGQVTWIHEMGHFFGLKHTFEPPIGLSDNTDCATSGDEICDTYADPNSDGINPPVNVDCEYIGTALDGNGEYYKPLTENYMSYYTGCQKSFTHQQYEKMIETYKINPEAHF